MSFFRRLFGKSTGADRDRTRREKNYIKYTKNKTDRSRKY